MPIFENNLARVYVEMSWVTLNVPYAPAPLACTTRSGTRSRLKCASFSKRCTSCIKTGPRAPAVSEFWLSATGLPAAVGKIGLSVIFVSFVWIAQPWCAPRTRRLSGDEVDCGNRYYGLCRLCFLLVLGVCFVLFGFFFVSFFCL